jgi:hypothetical protein
MGEAGDPEHVRTWRTELMIDVIQRARSCLVADGRADGLAPDCSLSASAGMPNAVSRATGTSGPPRSIVTHAWIGQSFKAVLSIAYVKSFD